MKKLKIILHHFITITRAYVLNYKLVLKNLNWNNDNLSFGVRHTVFQSEDHVKKIEQYENEVTQINNKYFKL